MDIIMIEISQKEKNYILRGNYRLLDALIADANRQILRAEKKYYEMLELEKRGEGAEEPQNGKGKRGEK
jgi:hypothetical protein